MDDPFGIDRRRNTCDMHQQNSETLEDNTRDLSEIRGSVNTIKWGISLGIPVMTLILGAWIGNSYSTLKDSMHALHASQTRISEEVHRQATFQATTSIEVKRNREELVDIKKSIDNLQDRRRTANP